MENVYHYFSGNFSELTIQSVPGIRDPRKLTFARDKRLTYTFMADLSMPSSYIDTFDITFNFRGRATDNWDCEASLSWGAGAWTIGDKQLNNVEVTYL